MASLKPSLQTKQVNRQARKRFLVYPKFQLTILGVNFLIMAVAFVVIGYRGWVAFDQLMSMGLSAGLNADHPLMRFFSYQSGALLGQLSIAAAVSFFFSGVVTLIFSHRLTGPIVRLRGYMQQIARDRRPKQQLKFREGDFFSDLPRDVNRAFQAVVGGRRSSVASATGKRSVRKAA